MGGDNRYLNYSTLVNGLSTVREFDFTQGEVVYAQNISSPRWCAMQLLPASVHAGLATGPRQLDEAVFRAVQRVKAASCP